MFDEMYVRYTLITFNILSLFCTKRSLTRTQPPFPMPLIPSFESIVEHAIAGKKIEFIRLVEG